MLFDESGPYQPDRDETQAGWGFRSTLILQSYTHAKSIDAGGKETGQQQGGAYISIYVCMYTYIYSTSCTIIIDGQHLAISTVSPLLLTR